jgi:hypothetical protein
MMDCIEELFQKFASEVMLSNITVSQADETATFSFVTALTSGEGITAKQGNYILRILNNYQNEVIQLFGSSAKSLLVRPVWKHTFRNLDMTKKITVVVDDSKIVWLHIKFPYALKQDFQREFFPDKNATYHHWDPDLKLHKIKLYEINTVQLYDFGRRHNFEFDKEFLDIYEQVEAIWQDENIVTPYCVIEEGHVIILNANENAAAYFDQHRTGNIKQDLFLAKSMGFLLKINKAETRIEKIASSRANKFWITSVDGLVEFLSELDVYPIVFYLDRSSDVIQWTKDIVNTMELKKFGQGKIKVCFRFDKDDLDGGLFNHWVKEEGLGGSMNEGEIFICNHKPPKWMIKEDFAPKIMISNTLYPPTNLGTAATLSSHHTTIYLGSYRPSMKKDTSIVNL